MTTPTKPVAEIVAEHRLWLRRIDPNGCRKRILGDDNCNCGACSFEAIASKLTRLSEERKWSPFKTVPRNGLPVLLTGLDHRGRRWVMSGQVYAKGFIGGAAVGQEPDYWMPLIELPINNGDSP